MLRKYLSLVLLLLFIFSHTAYSNVKLFPGYYIDLQGDSVLCQVEFNDWNKNPKTIQVMINNTRRELGPEEIKGFGVFGYCDYLSAKVSYHTKPVMIKDLTDHYSDSIVSVTCFLKVLEKGYYSLYGLVYKERVYFFMDYVGTPIAELVSRDKLKSDSLEEDQQYKKEIFNLFVKEGIVAKYFERIDKAQYEASDLESLFSILNESHTGIKVKGESSNNFQAEIYVGLLRNSFPTKFIMDYSYPVKFDPAYSFSGGANFLYSIPGNFKAFKVGLSAGYSSYKQTINQYGTNFDSVSAYYYFAKTYEQSITNKRFMLIVNLYGMYVINPLSKVNVYVKAGMQGNFSFTQPSDVYAEYTYTTDGIQNGNVPLHLFSSGAESVVTIKQNFISFNSAVGIITGRSKFEFSYSPPANLAYPTGAPLAPTADEFKYSTMGLYYFLNVH